MRTILGLIAIVVVVFTMTIGIPLLLHSDPCTNAIEAPEAR